jgi:nucleoside-diphosphate kinase
MSELTLGIIKPNATAKNKVGEILAMVEREGFRIRGLRMTRLTKAQAEAFYAVHRERTFYSSLVEFMCSGPVVVMALESDGAVVRWRDTMGATDPVKAAAGTIRKRFGDDLQANAVHGSDSFENARTEVAFFFTEADLVGTL